MKLLHCPALWFQQCNQAKVFCEKPALISTTHMHTLFLIKNQASGHLLCTKASSSRWIIQWRIAEHIQYKDPWWSRPLHSVPSKALGLQQANLSPKAQSKTSKDVMNRPSFVVPFTPRGASSASSDRSPLHT